MVEVVARHEILRTTYHEVEGNVVQRIAPASAFALPVVDLSALPAPQREVELQRHAAAEASTAFDLSQDRMLRAVLVRLNADEHVVLFTMHHIAADGWSMGVLTRELTLAYGRAAGYAAGEAPAPLACSTPTSPPGRSASKP